VKRARFAVLRTATMPAVLIECGFMSDPAEAKQIFAPAFRTRTAQAIVEGLLAYKRVVEQ
jgi:N-acetylmuramoyl-L-alanine amidase